MTLEEMAEALRAAGWRVQGPVDQKTCKHLLRRETGSVRSDGYSRVSGYCPECGASWDRETPAQPQEPFDISMQPRNGTSS